MEEEKFREKIASATKWSSVTEIVSKLITPLINIILARILAPEAFGVIVMVTMIMSFADMLKDAGFQKYMVQHEFRNEDEKFKNANVAFVTNVALSIILWCIIAIFSDQLSILIGNPGLGNVIIIACIQLPLTAVSSIQMALYQRDFDFKTLFKIRMVSIVIPVIVTLPLALLGLSYWSIILGSLVMQIFNAILLTYKSKWKPSLFFSFKILREMFSFSIWSFFEAISIWLTTWIDSFIIAFVLNEYYLGLYKTSTTMVNSFMSIITATVIPVLFSTLSRLQNDERYFNNTFFQMQKIVSIILFPIGVGVFLFSDLATQIVLGSQWSEASNIIGNWALTSAITIVLSHFCSEVYRAKGKPKLSFIAQTLHLIVLVPTIIISSRYGFWVLVYARSWIRLQGSFVHFILMKFVLRFPIMHSFVNVFPMTMASIIMGIFGYLLLQMNDGLLCSTIWVLLCIIIYFGVLSIFQCKEIIAVWRILLRKLNIK